MLHVLDHALKFRIGADPMVESFLLPKSRPGEAQNPVGHATGSPFERAPPIALRRMLEETVGEPARRQRSENK